MFTNEFFKNIVEIEDIFRRLSIKEKDKLQVICQAFSELSLTDSILINVKTLSFYNNK